MLINALLSTPLWVWALFAYLLFISIKATQRHTIHLLKLFIVPVILLALKYKFFIESNTFTLSLYGLALLIAVIVGAFFGNKTTIKIFKNTHEIELPGTYSTGIILLLFFIIKYCFGFLKATNPAFIGDYIIIETLINGLFSGYFLGRASIFSYKYIKA